MKVIDLLLWIMGGSCSALAFTALLMQRWSEFGMDVTIAFVCFSVACMENKR